MEEKKTKPELYVFSISHYCEKARFALDVLGIDYELKHLAPGAHMKVAAQLGAPGSSVPFLVVDGLVVQGSGAIMAWGDTAAAPGTARLGVDPEFEEECRALEERLDDPGGVHVRRYYYSEALIDHPETVRPIFTRELAPAERQATEENWGVICKLMAGAMDLGLEQWHESRAVVEAELDWLDGLLSDGRRYLIGDRFSRADITAASLYAALALPREHPTYESLQVPPRTREDLERWNQRPVSGWVREIYRLHR